MRNRTIIRQPGTGLRALVNGYTVLSKVRFESADNYVPYVKVLTLKAKLLLFGNPKNTYCPTIILGILPS
jgi:hypothetical protein